MLVFFGIEIDFNIVPAKNVFSRISRFLLLREVNIKIVYHTMFYKNVSYDFFVVYCNTKNEKCNEKGFPITAIRFEMLFLIYQNNRCFVQTDGPLQENFERNNVACNSSHCGGLTVSILRKNTKVRIKKQ